MSAARRREYDLRDGGVRADEPVVVRAVHVPCLPKQPINDHVVCREDSHIIEPDSSSLGRDVHVGARCLDRVREFSGVDRIFHIVILIWLREIMSVDERGQNSDTYHGWSKWKRKHISGV